MNTLFTSTKLQLLIAVLISFLTFSCKKDNVEPSIASTTTKDAIVAIPSSSPRTLPVASSPSRGRTPVNAEPSSPTRGRTPVAPEVSSPTRGRTPVAPEVSSPARGRTPVSPAPSYPTRGRASVYSY